MRKKVGVYAYFVFNLMACYNYESFLCFWRCWEKDIVNISTVVAVLYLLYNNPKMGKYCAGPNIVFVTFTRKNDYAKVRFLNFT